MGNNRHIPGTAKPTGDASVDERLRMSWSSMMALATAPYDGGPSKASLREARGGNYTFANPGAADEYYGCNNYSDALALARNGWGEGRDVLKMRLIKARAAIATPNRRRASNSVVGGTVRVASALSGDPKSFRRRHPVPDPKRVVNIVVNRWASCAYTTSELANLGAGILALTDALTLANISVGLHCSVSCCSQGHTNNRGDGPVCSASTRYSAIVEIKRPDQTMDLGRLAFALAHPGFLRRIGWRMLEVSKGRLDLHCYGSPCEATTEELPSGTDSLYIPSPNGVADLLGGSWTNREIFATPESAATALKRWAFDRLGMKTND